mgnify:CR=1 FL=1
MKKAKICCIGLGYIGLPTATMFAVNGYQVVGVDVQKNVIETINNGDIHIEEPGLKEMVKGAVMEDNLRASLTPVEADIFIIAVPTPLTDNKGANLEYVKDATKSIVPYLKEDDLVIIESTIAPRTTEDIVVPILEKSNLKIGKELLVAHCPERVLPGQIIHELMHNNRIIGGINEKSALKARKVYSSFVKGDMYITDATTAEMVKLMENTYRDVNIALANELAKISEENKIDIWEAIDLANKHPRVNVHLPGPGVGGHCLAVDPWFIVDSAPDKAKMIELSRNINDSMPEFVVRNVKEILFGIGNPKVSILGITYKCNVDDLRESPVLDIIKILEDEKVDLAIHDPHVTEPERSKYGLEDLENVISNSDIIVIGADHKEFKEINPDEIVSKMRNKIIYDTKNIIDKDKWEKAGFKVIKIGDYSDYDWQKKYGIKEIDLAEKEAAVGN